VIAIYQFKALFICILFTAAMIENITIWALMVQVKGRVHTMQIMKRKSYCKEKAKSFKKIELFLSIRSSRNGTRRWVSKI